MKQDLHKNALFKKSDNKFNIDSINSEEINQISDLLKLIWQDSFSKFLSDAPANILFCPKKIQEWINVPNAYVVVGKTQDSKIVGMISAFEQEDKVHISNLYIHPDFQRKGLGTILVFSVFNRFSNIKRFTLRVFEKNTKARDFYCSIGFCEISVRDAVFVTEKTSSILMEKVVD